ncbi:MAG: glycosyltransferase, partial [Terriglobia bacterium]
MSLVTKGWTGPEVQPSGNSNLMISLVVPTYNERANVVELVERTGTALAACSSHYELIIVDDASHDGTGEEVRRLQEGRPWLKLLERQNERDLSTAVVAGWRIAQGDIVGCMDADLQHPPELLPMLFRRLQKTGAAITVASRHVAGGGVSQWSLVRRFISWTATLMATFVLPGTLGKVRDPMSGFFLVRRTVLEGAALNPVGYKILLEVLAKGQYEAIEEVPFVFEERTQGGSKLGSSTVVKYLLHLIRLSLDTGEAWHTAKYALVGVSGAVVNFFVLRFLVEALGWRTPIAAVAGAGVAILNNFIWNEVFTFPEARKVEPGLTPLFKRLGLFALFSSSGLAINVLLISLLTGPLHVPLAPGVATGIAIAAIWNFFTNSNVTWRAWWNRRLLAWQARSSPPKEFSVPEPRDEANGETLVKVPCNICGSPRFEVLYEGDSRFEARKPAAIFRCTSEQHGDFTRIVRCLDCGLIYENPREPENLIHHNYAQVVDETYEREKEGRVRTFSRLLDDLGRFKKPGTLLEVGCYTGVFLEAAGQRGWQVTGVEPSRWAAGIARSKGLEVLN